MENLATGKLGKFYLKILISNYKKVKKAMEDEMICIDDVVFDTPLKSANGDKACLNLDFEEFDYTIESEDKTKDEAILNIRLKSLGDNWDELNETEGIFPENITSELVLESKLDNYVIYITSKDDENIYDFKIIRAAIGTKDGIVELTIPDEAYNSAEEVITDY